MKFEKSVTAKIGRYYYTVTAFALPDASHVYTVQFQPINAKTGRPWQAKRGLVDGANAHYFSNYHTNEWVCRPTSKEQPADLFEGGRWTSARRVYANREDAFLAIARKEGQPYLQVADAVQEMSCAFASEVL